MSRKPPKFELTVGRERTTFSASDIAPCTVRVGFQRGRGLGAGIRQAFSFRLTGKKARFLAAWLLKYADFEESGCSVQNHVQVPPLRDVDRDSVSKGSNR